MKRKPKRELSLPECIAIASVVALATFALTLRIIMWLNPIFHFYPSSM